MLHTPVTARRTTSIRAPRRPRLRQREAALGLAGPGEAEEPTGADGPAGAEAPAVPLWDGPGSESASEEEPSFCGTFISQKYHDMVVP